MSAMEQRFAAMLASALAAHGVSAPTHSRPPQREPSPVNGTRRAPPVPRPPPRQQTVSRSQVTDVSGPLPPSYAAAVTAPSVGPVASACDELDDILRPRHANDPRLIPRRGPPPAIADFSATRVLPDAAAPRAIDIAHDFARDALEAEAQACLFGVCRDHSALLLRLREDLVRGIRAIEDGGVLCVRCQRRFGGRKERDTHFLQVHLPKIQREERDTLLNLEQERRVHLTKERQGDITLLARDFVQGLVPSAATASTIVNPLGNKRSADIAEGGRAVSIPFRTSSAQSRDGRLFLSVPERATVGDVLLIAEAVLHISSTQLELFRGKKAFARAKSISDFGNFESCFIGFAALGFPGVSEPAPGHVYLHTAIGPCEFPSDYGVELSPGQSVGSFLDEFARKTRIPLHFLQARTDRGQRSLDVREIASDVIHQSGIEISVEVWFDRVSSEAGWSQAFVRGQLCRGCVEVNPGPSDSDEEPPDLFYLIRQNPLFLFSLLWGLSDLRFAIRCRLAAIVTLAFIWCLGLWILTCVMSIVKLTASLAVLLTQLGKFFVRTRISLSLFLLWGLLTVCLVAEHYGAPPHPLFSGQEVLSLVWFPPFTAGRKRPGFRSRRHVSAVVRLLLLASGIHPNPGPNSPPRPPVFPVHMKKPASQNPPASIRSRGNQPSPPQANQNLGATTFSQAGREVQPSPPQPSPASPDDFHGWEKTLVIKAQGETLCPGHSSHGCSYKTSVMEYMRKSYSFCTLKKKFSPTCGNTW